MRYIATFLLGLIFAGGGRGAPPLEIEVVCVDEQATGYGTFQSHNQKVVSNGRGIFMTHIRTRNEAYTAQQWRLSRSADGGKTFGTVFEATHATNPAVIETDAQGNLYLVRPDFADGNSYLHFFAAADDSRLPRVTPIPGSAAGKFAMAYDAARRQLYYCSQNHTFHIIGLDGTVRKSTTLLKAGKRALMQYPLLFLDPAGTLHLAWTTSLPEKYLYWDIHYASSPDGGARWQKMGGTALDLPIIADDSGSSDRISLEDEFEVHTWLSSFLVHEGKAHFLYQAQTTPPKQHYVRCDLKTGRREHDITPRFTGETIELSGLDGFFAASSSTLYCVAHTPDGRVGCLASRDNGSTWTDHAVSRKFKALYALGGCRAVTVDGSIIGSFTDTLSTSTTPGSAKVYFFRIPGVRAEDAWVDVSSSLIEKLARAGTKLEWPGGCSGVVVNRTNGDVTIKVVGHGLWRSSDGGTNWRRVDDGLVSGRDETGWATNADQNNPARIASFSLDGSAGWTADGTTWKAFTTSGRNWDYGSVDWGARDPATIIAAKHETAPPGEVSLSTDGGGSWKLLGIHLAEKRDQISMVGVLDATTLIYSNGSGIHRSTDGASTWTQVSPVNPQTRIPVLFEKTHYLGTAEGLLVSNDLGLTWQRRGAPVNIWVGPFFARNAAEVLVVGRDGVWKSADAGAHWSNVASLPPKREGFLFTPNWFGCYAWDPVGHFLYASSMGNPVLKLKLAVK